MLKMKGPVMGPNVEAAKHGNSNMKAGCRTVVKVVVAGTAAWILVRYTPPFQRHQYLNLSRVLWTVMLTDADWARATR